MIFKDLVLSVLNESPDGLAFQGKEYFYDRLDGNPIAFVIDDLMINDNHEDPWNESGDEINSYDSGLGKVMIYGKSSHSKVTTWSHTDMLESLSMLEHPYTDANKLDIYFYSPTFDVVQYLNKLAQKHPKMAVHAKGTVETLPANQTGRMWKVGKKVVVSLWDDDPQVMKEYVIPLINHVYPKVSPEDIMIEDQMTDTFYPSSRLGVQPKQQKEAYQKELADLQRQLHLASGDTEKKNKIIQRIVEICKEHGIDPKKYGISDEVLKSSQIYASKVGGTSKEPIASLKAKQQTSESKLWQNV
jgi:hypothetical protein